MQDHYTMACATSNGDQEVFNILYSACVHMQPIRLLLKRSNLSHFCNTNYVLNYMSCMNFTSLCRTRWSCDPEWSKEHFLFQWKKSDLLNQICSHFKCHISRDLEILVPNLKYFLFMLTIFYFISRFWIQDFVFFCY